MSRTKIDLIGPLAIIQGETYRELTWSVPGDKTTWTPRGQIRTALLQEEGELLAEFYFYPAVYSLSKNETIFAPYLTPNQTVTLPQTKYQGLGEISKRSVYYYDLEIEFEGDVIKTTPAVVQVIGEVTDGTINPEYPEGETYLKASGNLSELENTEEAVANLGLQNAVINLGGVANVIALTRAEYDAILEYSPTTLYLITD